MSANYLFNNDYYYAEVIIDEIKRSIRVKAKSKEDFEKKMNKMFQNWKYQ